MLRRRGEDIAGAHALDSMALIVESSQRRDRLLQKYMSDLALKDGLGNELPVHKHVMLKKRGEERLEGANYVIHTAGRQTLKRMRTRDNSPRKDFNAIFISVPKQLVSAFDVDVVSLQDVRW